MNTAWTIVIAVAGVVIAIASAVATFGSWRAARGSEKAAATLAAIEKDRRHFELTPDIELTCRWSSTNDLAFLGLTLNGPRGLDRLDQVAITIRDDRAKRSPILAGGPTQEELAAVIWGPLRFRPHVNDADKLGRSIPGFPLAQRESMRLALENSLPPRWAPDTADWRRRYADDPLRLSLTCTREGHASWTLPIDVPIESEPTGG